MIVIGAGGFAKELAEILVSDKYNFDETNLFFFDNVSENIPHKLFGRFKILRSFDEVEEIFENVSQEFSIGIGVPQNRYSLSKQFESLGGILTSTISGNAGIGSFWTKIGNGTILMDSVLVSNDVSVGKGTLINNNCFIGHDVNIGEFVEIMPGANITGHCKIGNYTTIGTGAIIIPKISIGSNCFINAGSVITKNVPDNSVVTGVLPSRVVERPPEFKL